MAISAVRIAAKGISLGREKASEKLFEKRRAKSVAERQSIEELGNILDKVQYKDWTFYLECRGTSDDYDVLLHVRFMAPDNENGGEPTLQKGRKWFLSRFSCPTEVIQTAWAAVHRAELHEIQEQFLYRGVSIWNNHVDVDALVTINGEIDQRG